MSGACTPVQPESLLILYPLFNHPPSSHYYFARVLSSIHQRTAITNVWLAELPMVSPPYNERLPLTSVGPAHASCGTVVQPLPTHAFLGSAASE